MASSRRRRHRAHLAARVRPGAWFAIDFCGERHRFCIVTMFAMVEHFTPGDAFSSAPTLIRREVLVLRGASDLFGEETQCLPEFLLDPARRPVFLGYGRPRPLWLLRLPWIGRRVHPYSQP